MKNSTRDNIISKIPVDVPSGSVLIWRNLTNHKTMINEKTINEIEIKITDENDDLLDLNAKNVHWTCTIQLDFIRLTNAGFNIMGTKQHKNRRRRKKKNKSIDNI